VDAVQRGDISSDSRLSGKVVAARDVTVYAPVAAEVLEISVKNGDAVEKDQVLFTLDSEDLEKQYQTLLDNYNNTEELLTHQVAAARQAVADTQILMEDQVSLAQENADNTQALYEIGAASRLERDNAQNTLTQAKINADSTIRQTELAYLQAQTNADSTLSSLKDSVEDMEDLLDDTAVKAPISGVVSALSVTKGAVLAPQMPACVVSETGNDQIAVSVSETAHRFLNVGDTADVTLATLSSDSFPASILSVSPAPNAVSSLL
jgi:multidrug resistance efflux pump